MIELTDEMRMRSNLLWLLAKRIVLNRTTITILLTYLVTLQVHDEYSLLRGQLRHFRHWSVDAYQAWSSNLDLSDVTRENLENAEAMTEATDRMAQASKQAKTNKKQARQS